MWDRSKEASMPTTTSMRPSVSTQYRLVTDRQTDRHEAIDSTANAQRRAGKNRSLDH